MSLKLMGAEIDKMRLSVPESPDMQELGGMVADCLRGGDVVLLSGPLGAGKTTFAQGLGKGLEVDGSVVSPTFTIARELHGSLKDGRRVNLIHVDAYRLGGEGYEPGEDSVNRLLDELESLGLDEELEEPGQETVVLMEWGEQMASVLANQRLEVIIDRPLEGGVNPDQPPTSLGKREVTLRGVGSSWKSRMRSLRKAVQA